MLLLILLLFGATTGTTAGTGTTISYHYWGYNLIPLLAMHTVDVLVGNYDGATLWKDIVYVIAVFSKRDCYLLYLFLEFY